MKKRYRVFSAGTVMYCGEDQQYADDLATMLRAEEQAGVAISVEATYLKDAPEPEGLDESEVAKIIMDLTLHSDLSVEGNELPEDTVGSGFYCNSGQRRFKVIVTECGEDV